MYDEENEHIEENSSQKSGVLLPIIGAAVFFIICAAVHFFMFKAKDHTPISLSLSYLYLFFIVFSSAAFGIIGSIISGVLSIVAFIAVVVIKGGSISDSVVPIIFILLFSIVSGGFFQFFKAKFMRNLEEAEEEYNALLGKFRALTITQEKMQTEDKKVAKLASRLVAVQTITKLLGKTMNPKIIMSEIMKTTQKIFGSEKCSVLITDTNKNVLVMKDNIGWDPADSNIKIPLGKGIAGYVAQEGEMLTLNEIKENYRFQELAKNSPLPSVMCAPLKHGEQTLGVLNIECFTEERHPSSEESRLLDFLGTLAGMAMNNAEMHSKIKRFAEIDSLTQMYNNRYFQEFLDAEIEKVDKSGSVVSIFMSDIDHFKNFNDTYGHQIGDFVLAENAKVLMNSVREDDLAARYGGEEFIVVMPDTDTKTAYELAEKYRKTVEKTVYHEGGHTLCVKVSIGVATYPTHAKKKDALIKEADEGLYFAKEGGRNMTIITADAKKKAGKSPIDQPKTEAPVEKKASPAPAKKTAVPAKKQVAAPVKTKTVSKTTAAKPQGKTKTVSKVVRYKLIKKIIKQPDGTQKVVQSKVRIED